MCAGIPKSLTQTVGNGHTIQGENPEKNLPKQQERDRQSQTWAADRCFYVKDPATSGKNTAHKNTVGEF